MTKNILFVATALGGMIAATVPALAVPYCTDRNPRVSVGISTGSSVFGPNDPDAEALLGYQMDLKRRGYDVRGLDRWNGCLQAYVRSPDGTFSMQFFDPNTLEPVQ